MNPIRSVRWQLYRSLLGWLLPLCLIAGIGTYAFVAFTLTSQFDATLKSKALSLSTMTRIEPAPGTPDGEHVDFDLVGEAIPEYQKRKHPDYFQIWEIFPQPATQPVIVEKSASLDDRELPLIDVQPTRPLIQDCPLPDGRPGRGIWMKVRVPRDREERESPDRPIATRDVGRTALVVIARPRNEIDRPLEVVLIGLIGAGCLAGLCAAAAVSRAVRRAMSPMESLSATVAGLDADNLPPQLNLPSLPEEIAPVGTRLEELIARLRGAIERERRFSGAAAHEMRTPLAEIKSLLDVRIRWPEDVTTCLTTLQEARAIADRMERLSNLLLDFVKVDAARTTLNATPVNLTATISRIITAHSTFAATRNIHITLGAPDNLMIDSDPTALESVLANLISNAVQYAPAASTISIVSATVDNSPLRLSVSNEAPSLTPDDLAHLFEPFWRQDSARTAGANEPSRTGLGLAIARSMAARIQCTLTAELDNGRLTMACVFTPHIQT